MTKTIFLTSLLIFQVSKLLQFNLVSKKDESVATNNLNPTTAGRDPVVRACSLGLLFY